ncbi:MAG TPA: TauD/TfdA family dioxygenase [Herpetosiphonaceae bacterium]
MTDSGNPKRSLGSLSAIKRKTITTSSESLVRMEPLSGASQLPLVVQPAIDKLNLIEWIQNSRSLIEDKLALHGGILFRSFDHMQTLEQFNQFITAVGGAPMEYHEGASPRTKLSDNIYTSTDYPAYQRIFLHNELAYRHSFPTNIFFLCLKPAEQQGETPIADMRRVYQRLDPRIREKFMEKGWMLVRNFGDGFGLPWQEVFHTTDKAEVERYCQQVGTQVEWRERGRLRTRQVCRAVAKHPRTQELVWFNHATFFHISTLEPTIREALLIEYGEDDLPTNTYYGDGSPIEPEVLDELRAIHEQETIAFPWQQGDLLMLDNLLVAHGRAPYSGPRKVVVGMSAPCSWDDVAIS